MGNRAPIRCSLHNPASQAPFWVRNSHNNPFHTSIKPVLRVCFYVWKLWPLQTLQTPFSLWNHSSSFCCNSHPTQGSAVCLLHFEAPCLILSLFLVPHQASESVKGTWGQFCGRKRCFTPKSREEGRNVVGRMLPVKTDFFSPPHKKRKLISLNSVFICKTKPPQKCLSKLPQFIPL